MTAAVNVPLASCRRVPNRGVGAWQCAVVLGPFLEVMRLFSGPDDERLSPLDGRPN